MENNDPIIIQHNGISQGKQSGSISLRYLDKFLRVSYYVGVCPNKFELSQDGLYIACRNWLQIGICFMFTILTILVRIYEMREMSNGSDSEPVTVAVTDKKQKLEPEEYFIVARSAGILMYIVAIVHVYWFNTENIVKQLNLASQFCQKGANKRQRKNRVIYKSWLERNQPVIWSVICVLYTVTSMAAVFSLDGIKCSWNFRELLHNWSQQGRELIFIPTSSDDSAEYSNVDVVFTIFNVLALFADEIYLSFGDLFLLISAVLLLVYVQEFEAELENISTDLSDETGNDFDFSAILEEYDMIQELVTGLNKVIGWSVLGLTLGSLPAFVTDFLDLLNPENTVTLIRVLLYFVHLFVFIMLATMVNQKAQCLENWVAKRRNYLFIKRSGSLIGVEEMIAIQQGKNVGISAGGFFIITSEFIGAWISLLLTFAIVIMEFRSSEADTN